MNRFIAKILFKILAPAVFYRNNYRVTGIDVEIHLLGYVVGRRTARFNPIKGTFRWEEENEKIS
jgi:hypothetical protein